MVKTILAHAFSGCYCVGINRPLRAVSHAIIILIISVVIPCTVEALEVGSAQEGLKHDLCFFMFGKYGFNKDIPMGFVPILGTSPQFVSCIDESRAKGGGGFIKFGGFDSLKIPNDSEPVFKQLSPKVSSDSTKRKDENIIDTYWHPKALLLGFSFGAWMVIFFMISCR